MSMHKGILGQQVGGATVDQTLGDYIHRKNVAAAFDAVNAEKAECCGNPLRGCMDCPPSKKLSFDDWYDIWIKNLPQHKGFVHKDDMRTAWYTAQRNM